MKGRAGLALAAVSCGLVAAASASAESRALAIVWDLDPADVARIESHLHQSFARFGFSGVVATSCADHADFACLRIARPAPSRLQIVVSDHTRTVRAERAVELRPHGLDAVHLEELTQIVETSLHALGVEQAAPRAAAALQPSREGAGFALALGYELGNWGSDVWIGGPRADLRYSVPVSAVRLGVSVCVWSGLPLERMAAGASVDLWPTALRAHAVGELRVARDVRVELALGVGFELLRATSQVEDEALRSAPTVTRANLAFRAAVAARWSMFAGVSWSVEPYLDLAPAEIRFGVERAQRFDPVLVLRGIRFGGALALHFEF